MPKQVYNILTFHGGLNNNADPRDMAITRAIKITLASGYLAGYGTSKQILVNRLLIHDPVHSSAATIITYTWKTLTKPKI